MPKIIKSLKSYQCSLCSEVYDEKKEAINCCTSLCGGNADIAIKVGIDGSEDIKCGCCGVVTPLSSVSAERIYAVVKEILKGQ